MRVRYFPDTDTLLVDFSDRKIAETLIVPIKMRVARASCPCSTGWKPVPPSFC